MSKYYNLRGLFYIALSIFTSRNRNFVSNNGLRQNAQRIFTFGSANGFFWGWLNSESEALGGSSRKKDNFIVDVTRKCSPSVVYIEIKDLKRIMPDTGQPITASNGSGFIIDANGWIMTNAHVVINRANALVMVTTSDGITYKAEVRDVDMKADLALLKIPAKNLSPLKMGDSSDISVGEWVVALGSPLSLSHTITAGVISSVNRDAIELGISNKPMKYIQTDAAITFGHSGGPLVNLDGEVIGINNLRITAGIAFAIPIDYAKQFLQCSSYMNPRSERDPVIKTLGVTLLSLNPKMISKLVSDHTAVIPPGLHHGVLVWKVLESMPGQKSGLEVGDIITHLNGTEVRETSDIYGLLAKANERVTLTVSRGGQQQDIIIYMKQGLI